MSGCVLDKRDFRRRGSATVKAQCRGDTALLQTHTEVTERKREVGKRIAVLGEAGERCDEDREYRRLFLLFRMV